MPDGYRDPCMPYTNETESPRRSAEDDFRAEVSHLHDCVEGLKKEMAENTAVTKEVRDILATFRVVGTAAKWLTGVGAFFVMLWHGWKTVTGQ